VHNRHARTTAQPCEHHVPGVQTGALISRAAQIQTAPSENATEGSAPSRPHDTNWEDAVRFITIMLGLMSVMFASQAAPAQEKYPTKPIRVLIPFGPGGAPDIVARVVGEQVRGILGQPFVIENKPGAFGILATEEMARSRPDGHTLMLGNVATNAMTPIIHRKKMTIDYDAAVLPVARLTRIPSFLAITPKIEPRTVAEFVAYAKARPGQIRYNTVGAGSFVHLDNVAFARKAGLDMVHIPVKSGAVQMINDIMLGDVHVSFLNVATSAAQVRAGGVRALAVTTDQRLPDFPDVPTMAEVGFAGIGTAQWQALFAPAATPPAALEILQRTAIAALDSPVVRETFAKSHIRIDPTHSLEEARTWLRREMADWAAALAEIKLDIDE
jgi:tripartite-type tricarboxylate transporter receptor subunit TctC